MKSRTIGKIMAGVMGFMLIAGGMEPAYAAASVLTDDEGILIETECDIPVLPEETVLAAGDETIPVDEGLKEDVKAEAPEDLIVTNDGNGSKTNPDKIDFEDTVNGNLTLTNEHDYYCFETADDGVVSIEGYCQAIGAYYTKMDVYCGDFDTTHHFFETSLNKGSEVSSPDADKFGVKKGKKYCIDVRWGSGDYTFKLHFTKSDFWEAEQDSIDEYKDMQTNAAYNGYICMAAPDTGDYYHFNLAKKSTIYIVGTVKHNCKAELYSDKTFTKDVLIESGWMDASNPLAITKSLKAGDYYVKICSPDAPELYSFQVKTKGGASDKPGKQLNTGTAKINGETVTSLRDAFKKMNQAIDYTIDLETDMIGEPNLTVPGKATSLIINGNGHKIKIIGSKFTSNCPIELINVTIETVNKADAPCKLTFKAKKGLTIGTKTGFSAVKKTFSVKGAANIQGDFAPDSLTADSIDLSGTLTAGKDAKIKVNKEITGKGKIVLVPGFKPLVINGIVSGTIHLASTEPSFPDGTQILSGKVKKLDKNTLKSAFDVAGLSSNSISENPRHLYYYKGGKAGIYTDNISYGGNSYGLWKDAVAQMNADKASGSVSSFNVTLTGDVDATGPLTLPKKGYESITIEGKDHTLKFKGNIKLTGNTTINNAKLVKVNNKKEQVSGKVVKGKFQYTGPETF